MALSEASTCWRESARDDRSGPRRGARVPRAQGWTAVCRIPFRTRRMYGRWSRRGAADHSIFRRPDLRSPEAGNNFKRSETMKRVLLSRWYLVFAGVVAVAILVAALPHSAVRAATEAARVVKYAKEDIVPVRAKLRFSTLIVLPEDEEILDFTTGDKEFWIINGAHNLCYVHPAQAGIRSNLNLITASGHVYSFLLTEISSEPNAEADLKLFIEPKEGTSLTEEALLHGYVRSGDVEAYKKELEALRAQTDDQVRAAQTQAAERVNKFRAEYQT